MSAVATIAPSGLPREVITGAQGQLILANDAFLAYVDPAGKGSTSRGGVMIQVNVRIAKHLDIDTLNTDQGAMLVLLRRRLSRIIQEGMGQGRLRREIKDDLWREIDKYIPLIQELA